MSDVEVVELLQQLIRNACVNDGSIESGEETRSADILAGVLSGPGVDIDTFESVPGRRNVVARIEGRDPAAPSLCLLGHTDVVPVNPENWRHDPFGGELIDDEVWGRGAIDMLNLTASMAVATRRLADSGWRPRGTLVFAAVADEEAGGEHGASFLVDHHLDAVKADYAITESGGFPLPTPGGVRLPVLVAERGTMWSRLVVRGTPGHGSLPFRTDSALVKAGEVVRRLDQYRPATRIGELWRNFVEALGFPDEMSAPLLRPDGFEEICHALPLGMARLAWSCTHTTITPTVMHAGSKLNVIPDRVEIELDIRTLPGDGPEEVRAMLDDALGDLAADVAFEQGPYIPATASPVDTPLWDTLSRVGQRFYEGSALVPMLMVGGTDNRHFRRAGTVGYGFGLFSPRLSFDDLATMGHGDNERIDVESLTMVTEMWDVIARDLLD